MVCGKSSGQHGHEQGRNPGADHGKGSHHSDYEAWKESAPSNRNADCRQIQRREGRPSELLCHQARVLSAQTNSHFSGSSWRQ